MMQTSNAYWCARVIFEIMFNLKKFKIRIGLIMLPVLDFCHMLYLCHRYTEDV